MNVATRNAPGIAEAMRYASLTITPRAMLSRGVSVIRNQTLIIRPSGKSQSGERKSGIYFAYIGTWIGKIL